MSVPVSYYNPVIETLSRDELKGLQWKKLKYQLEFQYHRNPYWRDVMQRQKVHPDAIQTPADYRHRMPLLTKLDLLRDQQEYPPYGSRLGVSPEKLVGIYHTSGTSGIGQEIYGRTRADTDFSANLAMAHHWAEVRRGDVVVGNFPVSAGQLAGPDCFNNAWRRIGVNIFHTPGMKAEDRINLMVKYSVQHINAVPAYLTRLAFVCGEMGIEPSRAFPRLKSIMVEAEAFSQPWAEKMEEFWGCKLFEMYGSSQHGSSLANTCEYGVVHEGRRGHMHIMEHQAYVEALDRQTGEPVADGDEGELILTNLEREASPLFRFRTDDKVVFREGGTCPCGRPFASFVAGMVARYDDMMKIKVQNVWPEAVDSVIFAHDEVVEYQGRVYMTDRAEEKVSVLVEFRAEVPPERREALIPLLTGQLRERIGVSMDLLPAHEALPRFEFKVRRWTDERLAGRERVFYTEKR